MPVVCLEEMDNVMMLLKSIDMGVTASGVDFRVVERVKREVQRWFRHVMRMN